MKLPIFWLNVPMFKIKNLIQLSLFILLTTTTAQAADLAQLIPLFQNNYQTFYQPRLCGRNTGRLIEAAQKLNIDLSNSYVLKIVGGGFWETSGFYTRNSPNDRDMLGYFHMVLVADNHVFDFDLNEPLVLPLEDYIRLQFTLPDDSTTLWGKNFKPRQELPSWEMTRFVTTDYVNGQETVIDKMKLKDLVNLDSVLDRQRLR